MSLFLQRTFDSLANGSAYAALAVAISMVFRSTGVLNLARTIGDVFNLYRIGICHRAESIYEVFFQYGFGGRCMAVWARFSGAIVISMLIGAFTERGDHSPD